MIASPFFIFLGFLLAPVIVNTSFIAIIMSIAIRLKLLSHRAALDEFGDMALISIIPFLGWLVFVNIAYEIIIFFLKIAFLILSGNLALEWRNALIDLIRWTTSREIKD